MAIAYGRASSDGRLVFIDAQEILDTITVDGAVGVDRFRNLLQPLLKPQITMRVYGEVVSLLAQRGQIDAAVSIEAFGQQVAHTCGIRVMCGYHLSGQRTLVATEIARVRALHDGSRVQGASGTPHVTAPAQKPLHAVRFYRDRESLARIVAGFLGDGLFAGLPSVVIATPAHRKAIRDALSSAFLDVDLLEAAGALIMVDAAVMLSRFMVGGMPDAARFKTTMMPLLERACQGQPHRVVRAYGEMVDVLWTSGQTVAAVRLEVLWNQLAREHTFALLCAYSMGHFYKDAAFQEICGHHTHVISDSGEFAPVPGY
jgi:hypothetical protein